MPVTGMPTTKPAVVERGRVVPTASWLAVAVGAAATLNMPPLRIILPAVADAGTAPRSELAPEAYESDAMASVPPLTTVVPV